MNCVVVCDGLEHFRTTPSAFPNLIQTCTPAPSGPDPRKFVPQAKFDKVHVVFWIRTTVVPIQPEAEVAAHVSFDNDATKSPWHIHTDFGRSKPGVPPFFQLTEDSLSAMYLRKHTARITPTYATTPNKAIMRTATGRPNIATPQFISMVAKKNERSAACEGGSWFRTAMMRIATNSIVP